jgi:hypothetical protein
VDPEIHRIQGAFEKAGILFVNEDEIAGIGGEAEEAAGGNLRRVASNTASLPQHLRAI